MQYLLLIHEDEKAFAARTDADRNAMYAEYATYIQSLSERGVYVGGHQLQPTQTATTVRVRDGERLVTDGPFAETKEQLGGYFLIEAESLDEAIDAAAGIPSARVGTIEVRPLVPSRVGAAA
jgi:hypothetical protein